MPLVQNALCQTLNTEFPFWQAPLPFDLISPEMSGKISAAGGHGILRISAYETRVTLEEKIKKYRQYHDLPSFCFSHHLPHQAKEETPSEHLNHILKQRYDIQSLEICPGESFYELLQLAISHRPRAIGFSQGVPDPEVFTQIKSHGIQTFTICSNMLELLTADDFGCDSFVLQGTEAGGQRCSFSNQLPSVIQPALSFLQQARHHTIKPLVVWGDCSEAADIVAAMISGAQGVMLDRPFVACPENGLDENSRKRVITGSEFDSIITDQFTASPLRCLQNNLTRQPEKLLSRNEALFAAAFAQVPQNRPLSVSLSPIEDPENLEKFFERQKVQIQQYIA